MTNRFTLPLIFSIAICCLFSCRTEQIKTEIQLSDIHKILLLDSVSASKSIVKDDIDLFFDKITPIDMMIQMKREYPEGVSRPAILEDYKKFIQTDIANFTKDEADFLAKILSEAYELCQKAEVKYFPEEIRLIKTKGQHYGDDTYYTRENTIVIPQQALKTKNNDVFLQVMLHEISHIVTRLNPTVKSDLFALLGFKKLNESLVIQDSLKQRLLTNPDGTDMNWVTQLTVADGQTVTALPLIYANDFQYKKNQKAFFNNMGFNYFEITQSVDTKSFEVLTIGNKQKSTLNTEGINDIFFKQFNTNYIIHPDEIVADNFALLIQSYKNSKILEVYTEGGRKLIEKMKLRLQK